MGQLERYGLYVLCLVIFLILGVAIWGGDPAAAATAAAGERALAQRDAAHVPGRGTAGAFTDLEKRPVKLTPLDGNDKKDATPHDAKADGKEPSGAAKDASRDAKDASRDAKDAKDAKKPLTPPAGGHEPKPSPLPLPGKDADETWLYVIKSDDTLIEIAQRELGSASRWQEIARLNPTVQASHLKPKSSLKMPPRHKTAAAAAVASDAGAKRDASGEHKAGTEHAGSSKVPDTYTVARGDSPASISQKFYGSEKFTAQIMELNKIADPHALKQGAQIRLPRER